MQLTSSAPSSAGSLRLRRKLGRAAIIVLFLLPAVAIFTIFVVWPVAQAAYFSLFKWNGLGPLQDFIGLQNYLNILEDRLFRTALSNNLFILVLSLVVQLPLALGLALLVGRKMKGRA